MDAIAPFKFAFTDKEWGQKFVILTLLTLTMTAMFALALVFSNATPLVAIMLVSILVVVGLFPLCIVLGYMLGVVRRVEDDDPILLPRWSEWDELIARGAGLLFVIAIYNIPLIISLLTLVLLPRFLGTTNFSGWASLLMLCCVLPFVLLLTALGWLALAVGIGRYAKGAGLSLFFRPETLLKSAFASGSYSAQWLMLTLIYNLGFMILLIIPCIGWMLYGAFMFPAHGHLLGQYAKHIAKQTKGGAGASAKKPASNAPAPQKPPRPLSSRPRK